MTEPSIKPFLFISPFAHYGDRDWVSASSAATNEVTESVGYPLAYSSPRANGGKSVERKKFNQLLYMISTLNYYFQRMGRNPWREVAYPQGAVVWYDNAEYVSKWDQGSAVVPTNTDYWTKLNDINGNVVSIDMSNYYTSSEIDSKLSGKTFVITRADLITKLNAFRTAKGRSTRSDWPS